MLGKLAKLLRIMGYDTLYFRDVPDDFILYVACEEGNRRILVTKDVDLAKNAKKLKINVKLIYGNRIKEQLGEMKELLVEKRMRTTRCPLCNGLLRLSKREEVYGEVPEYVWYRNSKFYRCSRCNKIFWEGSHVPKIKKFLEDAL